MNGLKQLALLGKVPLEAWDFIIPHGHRLAAASAVQPSPADTYVVAAARLAHDVSTATVEADYTGQDASSHLLRLVDEWCGTPWPRRWPLPFPWPGPWPPEPDPWWEDAVATGRLVGAVVFATMAERLRESDLGAAFGQAAEQLLSAASPERTEAAAAKTPARSPQAKGQQAKAPRGTRTARG